MDSVVCLCRQIAGQVDQVMVDQFFNAFDYDKGPALWSAAVAMWTLLADHASLLRCLQMALSTSAISRSACPCCTSERWRACCVCAHVFVSTCRGSAEEKLELAFKAYDLDGNGSIDRCYCFASVRSTCLTPVAATGMSCWRF